jgi:regulation of enolase protein 1 (concanavalin A-like superfamily)
MNDRTTCFFNRRVTAETRARAWLSGGSLWRLLAGVLLGLDLAAAEVNLAWDPSPDSGVIAYRIYWGTRSRVYTQHLEVGRVTTATVTGLSAGSTYFFAATALAAGGLESDFSNEVQYTVPNPPANQPPTVSFLANLTIAEDTSTGPIFFTVGDPDNAPAALTVSAFSGNPTLVPAGGLVLGGTGANRTLTVTPAAQRWGTATITVRVSDGALSASRSFVLTVVPVNDPPGLSFLANRTIAEDTSIGPIPFTVWDVDNDPAALAVSAVSSNPTLVPADGLVLGGSGASRTLAVTPAADQWGTATITVRVSDGALVTARAFVLTVTPVNDPPAISVVADQTLAEGASTGPIAFTVGDVDNDPAALTVTVASDHPALLPPAGLVLGGNGASRTLAITPAPGQSGAARVTLTVSDGSLTASRAFGLTVVPRYLPAPWQTADLGTPVPAGAAGYAGGVFTLEAGGQDLGGFADEGFFLYQPLAGDGVITARVRELENVLLPRAGVMIRESLDNSARMVFLHLSPYTVSLAYRVTPGSYAFNTYAGPPRPAPDNWLRLVRAGNTFSAYHSSNGVDWNPVSLPVTLSMGAEVYVGLAASSGWSGTAGFPGRSTRAVFDQVQVVR